MIRSPARLVCSFLAPSVTVARQTLDLFVKVRILGGQYVT